MKDYKPDEMRAAMEKAGINMGAGRLGMPTDEDGIRLQLLGVPGGLARTIIPSTRITTDDAAVAAIGLDHIVLAVSDMDRSAAHYAKFFGAPATRTKKPEAVWFQVARTRLALVPVALGGAPAIARVCVRIAGFDRRSIPEKLKKLGVEVLASNDEHIVRFKDPDGFVMDLKAA